MASGKRGRWRAYATRKTYFDSRWFVLATGSKWWVWLRAKWYTVRRRRRLAHVIHERSWHDFEGVMVGSGYKIHK